MGKKSKVLLKLAESRGVTEHAIGMSGGSKEVRANDPEIDRVYPLAEWITHQQRFGGKVYRRRIVVIEDWTEVERTP